MFGNGIPHHHWPLRAELHAPSSIVCLATRIFVAGVSVGLQVWHHPELRLAGFARYRITGFQPFGRCYVAPAQTQQLTDDFVEHLAQRFGLSRDAAEHALGELLFYYHDVRQRRAQALKQRESLQVSRRITATWKLATVH
jgi:hypothetical protein